MREVCSCSSVDLLVVLPDHGGLDSSLYGLIHEEFI